MTKRAGENKAVGTQEAEQNEEAVSSSSQTLGQVFIND